MPSGNDRSRTWRQEPYLPLFFLHFSRFFFFSESSQNEITEEDKSSAQFLEKFVVSLKLICSLPDLVKKFAFIFFGGFFFFSPKISEIRKIMKMRPDNDDSLGTEC